MIKLGRPPIIRDAIIKVLEKNGPMVFGETRKAVAELLGRKKEKVYDQNIAYNLRSLTQNGVVKQTLINGLTKYNLTQDYYRRQIKACVISILQSWSDDKIYPKLEGQNAPLVVFSAPFIDIRSDQPFNALEGTTRGSVTHLVSDWGDVKHVFATRMLEAFVKLKREKQKGIGRLLAWSYWYTINEMIEEHYHARNIIENCSSSAQKALNQAEQQGDWRGVEAEKTVISILNITEELMSRRKNLEEFLHFARDHGPHIKKLQGRILEMVGHLMVEGETIFDQFLQFHGAVKAGLIAAGLLPKSNLDIHQLFELSHHYRYMFSYGDVWTDFISTIFLEHVSLDEIKGNMNEALSKVKAHKEYIKTLLELVSENKICAVYMWGFPEIFELSDKSFLPVFEKWCNDLRLGHLDHRRWLFTNGEEILVKAVRTLKRGGQPPNIRVDINEIWTIRDLCKQHPRSGIDLLQQLLKDVRERKKLISRIKS